MCDRCRLRQYRWGDPNGSAPRKSITETFWEQVAIAGPDDCWEWQGWRDKKGYGRFQRGHNWAAHRFAYQDAAGPGMTIPPGMHVCHVCDNPPCCNPNHLWLGSSADNTADAASKGRLRAPRGESCNLAKLTAADVLAIRADSRSQSTIADAYQISQSHVSGIKLRRVWRHLGD